MKHHLKSQARLDERALTRLRSLWRSCPRFVSPSGCVDAVCVGALVRMFLNSVFSCCFLRCCLLGIDGGARLLALHDLL